MTKRDNILNTKLTLTYVFLSLESGLNDKKE